MVLVYIDESESQSTSRYFLGALLASERSTKSLVQNLNKLGKEISERFDVAPRAEFHGYDITHGKKDWAALSTMTRARLGVFKEIIETITAHDVTFLVRGVDTAGLAARYAHPYPAHEVCLQHIIQRLERHHLSERDELALLIADEHQSASSLRTRLRDWEENGTAGPYLRTTPERLLDTIHFTPSFESRMLQAADVLTYFYQRRMSVTPKSDAEKRYMDELWERFAGILHPHWGIWYP